MKNSHGRLVLELGLGLGFVKYVFTSIEVYTSFGLGLGLGLVFGLWAIIAVLIRSRRCKKNGEEFNVK